MRFLIATYAWFLATLPEAFARANAWGFSWILWGLRRKIITRNLAASFPEKDAAWVRRIGQLCIHVLDQIVIVFTFLEEGNDGRWHICKYTQGIHA